MLRPLSALALLTLLPTTLQEAPVLEWEAEAELRRTLSVEIELVLDSATFIADGEEMDVPFPDLVQKISGGETIVDSAIEVEDGTAMLLSRTFEETGMTVSIEADGEGEETEQETDLDGRTVLFRYDADDEEYAVEYSEDDSDGDEEALEDLRFDLDLRSLLPDGEVEVDESWDLDPDLLERLNDPCGDLAYSDGEEQDEEREAAMEELFDSMDGDFTATFLGEVEEDGRTLFVVGIEADLEGSASWEAEIDMSDAPFDIDASAETTITMAFELEGELAWDTRSGHLIRLDLGGDVTLIEDTVTTIDSEQFSGEQQQTLEFAGELTQTLRTE